MANINASIEVSPKQAAESKAIVDLFPQGGRVYITDVGTDPTDYLVSAAKRVRDLGYEPVPHFASRRMLNADILEDRVARMVSEAAVTDVLVIGGGLEKEAGSFASTMELLETGVFQRHGITHMGIAGHPEGSPDFDDDTAMEALHQKQAFAENTGLNLRIVTQFGFDAPKFIDWTKDLQAAGITMPIHLGVAGPAKVTTLIKFAAMCGVGNSLSFLKKRGGAMATMVKGFDPNDIVDPIEEYWRTSETSLIEQIHVFPFGGAKKSTAWLTERGSWSSADTFPVAATA
jgi:methylenetetrahydrofolate reductase (NADPH)